MQSMKEMLKTLNFLRFMAVQAGDRHNGFAPFSHADGVADIQRYGVWDAPLVHKGAAGA
jgi:hypothetical protein